MKLLEYRVKFRIKKTQKNSCKICLENDKITTHNTLLVQAKGEKGEISGEVLGLFESCCGIGDSLRLPYKNGLVLVSQYFSNDCAPIQAQAYISNGYFRVSLELNYIRFPNMRNLNCLTILMHTRFFISSPCKKWINTNEIA